MSSPHEHLYHYVLEHPSDAGLTPRPDQAVPSYRTYAGYSASLGRADVEVLADERNGTFAHWEVLTSRGDQSPKTVAEARAEEAAYLAEPEDPEAMA